MRQKGYREKRGTQGTLAVNGRSYDEVWAAAVRVADVHFEIREQDKEKGIIKAERSVTIGAGAWIDISIVPPTSGYDQHTIQVFSLKRGPNEQSWEKKILRDIDDVLAGRPMR